MTVLLLLVMAFQITGQKFHEWFGAGMLVLFLIHNILDFKWYRSLFKGKYSIIRVLQTIINFAVLFSMLCLAGGHPYRCRLPLFLKNMTYREKRLFRSAVMAGKIWAEPDSNRKTGTTAGISGGSCGFLFRGETVCQMI